MANLYPFSPAYGSTQSVTAGSPAASITINAQNKAVRIVNFGPDTAYVRTYTSASGTVAAAATDMAIPAFDIAAITKDQMHDRLSYFAPSGSAVLSVMTGEGW